MDIQRYQHMCAEERGHDLYLIYKERVTDKEYVRPTAKKYKEGELSSIGLGAILGSIPKEVNPRLIVIQRCDRCGLLLKDEVKL